jgi:hypothetical protein
MRMEEPEPYTVQPVLECPDEPGTDTRDTPPPPVPALRAFFFSRATVFCLFPAAAVSFLLWFSLFGQGDAYSGT